jgi:translation initiation factor IF-3
LDIERALGIAQERDYDLVEVSPNTDPPVAKLIDYGKYKYQQLKKEQKQKKITKQKEIKIIRLSARIDKHDLTVKLKKAEEFLTKRHKVKVILMLKGREMDHSEMGFNVIDNFTKSLEKVYKNKEGPKRERNVIEIYLFP